MPTGWKPFYGNLAHEKADLDVTRTLMPTLFRLLITILFLAGLVYAGMFALVSFVEPNPKDVTQRIPTRELLGETAPARPAGMPTPNVTSTPEATPGQ